MARALLASACLSLTSAALLVAQQPLTFRARVDTIDVHVTVRTSDGRLVPNLTKDDFELYDDGKPREITVFSGAAQPIAMSLLIDRSGSIVEQAQKVTAAAETFVGELQPGDRAAVHTLGFECLRLTPNRNALVDAIRHLAPMDPGSPVWSGLDLTMSSMAGEAGRRAILLFSDGDDTGNPLTSGAPAFVSLPSMGISSLRERPSQCRPWTNPSDVAFADALKRAQRDGVMIYAVSVENARGHSNDDDLRTIARNSGGERYRLREYNGLSAAFKRIADELHHQYLLGFVPATYDGKVHNLDVRVKRPGLTARGRKSYVADRSDATGGANPNGAPLPPLAADDVEAAIKRGVDGQKLQASCAAVSSTVDSSTLVNVTLEGPLGRIMRLAREARAERRAFESSQVTEELRRPMVQVTAEATTSPRPGQQTTVDPGLPALPNPATGVPPTTGDPPVVPVPLQLPNSPATTTPGRGPQRQAALISVLLRSKVQTEHTVQPEYDASTLPRLGALPQARLIAFFDLAAFRALPGDDAEVVVRSSAALMRCTIPAKDKGAIK